MKYDVNAYSDADVMTTTVENDITLSPDSASLIFQMFSRNIYSNPIGSIVREITSNCFDSHVEAGVNMPVLIKKTIDPQTQTTYISFIDYGVGMLPERIKNVFSVMFSSTKRDDNTQIGAFGLGSKVPLAYKRSTGFGAGEYDNSYSVITRYNNIEYTYQIYEGNKCPRITLLNSDLTSERNGTEIRIPVLEKDQNSFCKEMVRQLYYFENIVFEGFDDDNHYGETLMNEYQIIRGKSFLFRGSEYQDYMHVCLGRVAYPLDYNTLGLNSNDYRLPIAIRLEVGDIGVTVSRESLDYSESTIKMLKKKLEIAKAEIKDLITKQYSNVQSLEDYFKVKHEFGKLVFANGASINVGNIIKQSDVDFSNFKYSFLKMPNDKQLFRFFFDTNSYGKKPRRSRYSSNYSFDGGYEELQRNTNLLYIDGEFIRKVIKQAYLKSVHELYHIIGLRNICDNAMRNEISELFNVHLDKTVDDNGKPVPYVQTLIEMQEEFFDIVKKHAVDYDKLDVPESFIQSRKRNVMSKELRNTTISVKFVGGSKCRVKLDDLFNYDCPIFYGNQSEESALYNAYRLYSLLFDKTAPVSYYSDYNNGDCFNTRRSSSDKNKKSIMFIMLADNNLKYMKYCKKAQTVNNFFLKMLRRKEAVVKQYFQTYDVVNKFEKIDGLYTSPLFARVSPSWTQEITALTAKINAIPEKAKDSNIGSYKSTLERYFDLSDIKMTDEQKSIEQMIDNILTLQALNDKILRYIDMPYRFEDVDNELVEILKKIMIL